MQTAVCKSTSIALKLGRLTQCTYAVRRAFARGCGLLDVRVGGKKAHKTGDCTFERKSSLVTAMAGILLAGCNIKEHRFASASERATPSYEPMYKRGNIKCCSS